MAVTTYHPREFTAAEISEINGLNAQWGNNVETCCVTSTATDNMGQLIYCVKDIGKFVAVTEVGVVSLCDTLEEAYDAAFT